MKNFFYVVALSLPFQVFALPTPLEGLDAINSGKLKYLGRDLFPGNDQNRTCVYKSDKAYILYNNCLSSKKESSATDIEVILFDGNILSYYVQNAQNLEPVSTQLRSQYSMTWSVGIVPSDPVGTMNLAQLKIFKQNVYDAMNGGCFIGGTFKAQAMDSVAQCYGGFKDTSFNASAESFWRGPGTQWYETQKYLRKVVIETKF